MADNDGSRTEPATPRRRQQAWDQGQFARSSDLTAALVLLAAVVAVRLVAVAAVGYGTDLFRLLLHGPVLASPAAMAKSSVALALPDVLRLVGPLVAVAVVVTAAAAGMQSGMRFSPRALRFDLTKLLPSMGFGRLFSQQTWVSMAMNLLKMSLVIAVAWVQLKADIPVILSLARSRFPANMAVAGELLYALAWRVAGVLVILALLDYLYHRWKFERDIRMTRQEVKDDFRSMEGDVQLKGRRRQLARKMILQRLATDVPRADVVVTNPTELAIALKYDPATMAAPRVVAKGAGFLAMRIRQVAMQSGVPLLERKPLAQALYKSVEVGQEVPPQYYQAIAEILAYVYELSGKGQRIRKSA